MRLPFFYGWIIVAVGVRHDGVGVNARTGFSLLFPPILDEFGWDRGIDGGRVLVRLPRLGLAEPVRSAG